MSDGVHDNLDPQTLGLSPRDFDIDNDRWEASPEVFSPFPSSFPSSLSVLYNNIENDNDDCDNDNVIDNNNENEQAIVSEVKRIYLAKVIEKMLKDIPNITPKVVKDILINHCVQITTKSRLLLLLLSYFIIIIIWILFYYHILLQ